MRELRAGVEHSLDRDGIDRLARSDAEGFKPGECRRVSKAGRIVDHECVQAPEEAGCIHVRDLRGWRRPCVDGGIGERHRNGTIRFLPRTHRCQRQLILEIVHGRGVARSVELDATKEANEIRRGFDRRQSSGQPVRPLGADDRERATPIAGRSCPETDEHIGPRVEELKQVVALTHFGNAKDDGLRRQVEPGVRAQRVGHGARVVRGTLIAKRSEVRELVDRCAPRFRLRHGGSHAARDVREDEWIAEQVGIRRDLLGGVR